MREIKFRVWDEQNKVMHFDVDFIRSGREGNDWIIFKSDKQKLEDEKVLDNPYFAQQIKLMQFTGLKDKNGKEIYEGDILRFETDELNGTKVFVVGWGGYGFCFEPYQRNVWRFGDYQENYEVIGNIYENPELLK